MKKLLTVLFILPLIFSSCEKEEETQSNNNSSDVIIGDWSNTKHLPERVRHLTFYSNNTYEDYFIEEDDGSISEHLTGTWENLGGGVYYYSLWGGVTFSPIFYCDENVMSKGVNYWGRNNYDVQSCSEINL